MAGGPGVLGRSGAGSADGVGVGRHGPGASVSDGAPPLLVALRVDVGTGGPHRGLNQAARPGDHAVGGTVDASPAGLGLR